ncbi:hypothetical protein [Hymenobacter fodinae]|uniref:Uncharacterized protein n=1 Tax=Hymenobacter fodinae TaxID=2510796 RepID=A0A4Z0P513_9BACT|nr:hypothetical protein [Hymenobacter fodinae]TGE05476.1 hypothetical protein EU556_19430 [Hymenobacter fodinae]
MSRSHPLPYSGLSVELQQLLPADHCCVLVYRTPGTSAEFSVRTNVLGLLRRGTVDFLCLDEGRELPLDWLVAVDGHRLAA